jgi:hypothetical protein
MHTLVAASALFLAGGLSTVSMGALPMQGVLNEFLWTGMAVSAFITVAGLEAAS